MCDNLDLTLAPRIDSRLHVDCVQSLKLRACFGAADQHTQTNLPYEDEAFVPVAQSSTPICFPQGLLRRAVVRRVQRARGDVPGEGS